MPADLAENTVIAERFRLLRPIGRGQMGSVWLAHHLRLDVLCAIKFIDGSLSEREEVRIRLEREARAQAQLRSPHIVHIFDYGVWRETPYLAMEFLQGETLAARLERVGRLDGSTAHRVVAHIARALTKAHAAGIIHRDLKPENVFLVADEEEGEIAKVVDFGVAKLVGGDFGNVGATHEGALIGTPLYMSPEQARGKGEVDHRSDLWSLAVIAFRCLTGELPFYSEALGDLLSKIMFERVPLPSEIAPDLPPDLDAWWVRAAARSPDERFQSARELADALGISLGMAASAISAVPPALLPSWPIQAPSVAFGVVPDPMAASHPAVARSPLLGVGPGPASGLHRWLGEPGRRALWGSAAAALLVAGTIAIAAVVGSRRHAAVASPAAAVPNAEQNQPPATPPAAPVTPAAPATVATPTTPAATPPSTAEAPEHGAPARGTSVIAGDPASSSTEASAIPARRPVSPEELPMAPHRSRSSRKSSESRAAPAASTPTRNAARRVIADPLDGRK